MGGLWMERNRIRLLVYALAATAVLGVSAIKPVKALAGAFEAELIEDGESVQYATLESALENWQDGQTLRLCSDAVTSTIYVTGEKTLDLGGYTLCGEGNGSVLDVKGTLTLKGGTITGGKAAYGGGISVSGGELYIENSTVKGNSAESRGGGIALFSGSKLEMSSGTIEENSAQFGGGIYSEESTVRLSGTAAVLNNSCKLNGGGLYLDGEKAGAALEIKDSVRIEENSADEYGGGISLWLRTEATIFDSASIQGNSAKLGGGGAFVHAIEAERESVLIVNGGTFRKNSSEKGCGGIEVVFGGILRMFGGTVTDNSGKIGGIHVYQNGFASFGGTAVVTENFNSEGDKSNVYLMRENNIIIESGFAGTLGIGMAREGVIAAYSALDGLTSDFEGYELLIEEGMLRFARENTAQSDPVTPSETRNPAASETALAIIIAFAAVTALTVLVIEFVTRKKA